MTVKCPAGHDSTERDFCSDCGLEMPAPAPENGDDDGSSSVAARTEQVARESCPKCKTDRDDPGSAFCGICGYNFVTRQSGDVVQSAMAAPRPAAKTTAATLAPAEATTRRASHIEIEVTFDESKAEAPKGRPPRKFSLYDEESLIGRRSNSVAQTVRLEGDDGVSRRHILIIRQPSGSYIARLFDNTNGGTLNGVEMTAGVEEPLAAGDALAIGAFTIVRVSALR